MPLEPHSVSVPKAETIIDYDGQGLRKTLWASGQWLKQHAAVVNALNVFPVPDGDTGTNMSLTINAALTETERCDSTSVSGVAQAAAHGALMGARGNSGVILSQILRGFAHSLDGKESISAHDLALAAQEAYDTAVRGVIKPVEGTILTVMRETARATREAIDLTSDPVEGLALVVEAAKDMTARTPEYLPVLREAGVVDAGGQGLVFLLEGALRQLRGEDVEADASLDEQIFLQSSLGAGPDGYGYDVQFLIKGEHLNVEEIRGTIDAMGDSTIVVGDSSLIKVHVHVHDPSVPLGYGIQQGPIFDVVVENMEEQYKDFIREQVRQGVATEEITDIAIIAVVPGEGLMRIFESMGTSAIVPGGQTMNPSTQEILDAIEKVNADQVLVLPNNSNVILAARQAKELTSKEVIVVPTKTVPEGISALMAFNYQADLASNAERMTRNLVEIQTIEITNAVRTTQLNGLLVEEGDIIALLNDVLVSGGQEHATVALEVLDKASAENYEVATIYFGQDASQAEAETLADLIRDAYPDLEVDVYDGGQAHYRFILSLE